MLYFYNCKINFNGTCIVVDGSIYCEKRLKHTYEVKKLQRSIVQDIIEQTSLNIDVNAEDFQISFNALNPL